MNLQKNLKWRFIRHLNNAASKLFVTAKETHIKAWVSQTVDKAALVHTHQSNFSLIN